MATIADPGLREGHIFLSHAGTDTQAARGLADALRRHGLDVWFDKDNLQPGDSWMPTLESAISKASAMIVYVGRSGIQTWVDREVSFRGCTQHSKSRSLPSYPRTGRGSERRETSAFCPAASVRRPTGQSARPRADSEACEVLRNPSFQAAIPAEYWTTHCPFRSLRVFEPEDSWLFFGRDSDTDELLTRLGREPVLAVIGNSGSGKSSLIRAGLIPALRRGRFRANGSWVDSWRIVIFRPTRAPFDELAERLTGQLASELSPRDRVNFIEDCKEKFASGGNSVRNAIAAIAGAVGQPPEGERVLLVADQFEELFTLVDDKTARQHYIESLLAAARLDGAIPVHLVLALRADFYANCLDHPALSVALNRNLYNLPLMSSPQLLVAIENRLALAAAHAETGLIDSLLADLGSEPGNLALLEHALAQLWDKYGGSGCTLTSDAYAEIGRLRGALRRHADEVYDALGGEDERGIARKIFLELVQLGEGAQDTRRRVKKTSLLALGDDSEAVQRILGRLTDARLITTSGTISADGEIQDDVVEVAHEVLIREWSRLKTWIDESRAYLPIQQRVVLAAKAWIEHDLKPEYLLVREQLDEASRLPEDYRRDLSDEANAFLQESLDEEKRRERARESQTQTEMAAVAWLELIDILVDDAEQDLGLAGPSKLQRVKQGVSDTLRDMGLYEIIPKSKSLEPVVMDVLVEWCVVLLLTIKNQSSLWSESIDAKHRRRAEFLTERKALEPNLFSHWKILFTEFVGNNFLWMITHEDVTAITIRLAVIAVTEAERYVDLSGPRKKSMLEMRCSLLWRSQILRCARYLWSIHS